MLTIRVGIFNMGSKKWFAFPDRIPSPVIFNLIRRYTYTRFSPHLLYRLTLPDSKKVYIWKGEQISFELATQLIGGR